MFSSAPARHFGQALFVCTVMVIAAMTAYSLSQNRWLGQKVGGASWALTYEASATHGDASAAQVRYQHNPDRHELDRSEEATGSVPLPWKKIVNVNRSEDARLEVVPKGNDTVSCRILLDERRVVAQASSPAPGRPAVCEVTTGERAGKWSH
ncbi:hypothetical protein [Streptomyces chrestomyceticus]|uniref:hypothetical protein n=1 Tax=Streptomyces chrestomyceticus TaxID=68185 RepID=UPI0033FC236D